MRTFRAWDDRLTRATDECAGTWSKRSFPTILPTTWVSCRRDFYKGSSTDVPYRVSLASR